jgi:hypothetical protein
MSDGTTLALDGQVWICGACGKRSRTRYGFDESKQRTAIDRGWDESCMLHAVLCHDDMRCVGGVFQWVAVEAAE